MIRFFLVLVFAFSVAAKADFTTGFQQFGAYADQVVNQTWGELARCNLNRLHAYDPRLPRPQVPAHEAVVNRFGRVLAYSFRPWYYRYEFKNPNGGQVHSVSFGDSRIEFTTPYGGTVASSNWVNYGGYWTQQYFCRGFQTDYPTFLRCVEANFVQTISQQLCRYGE